MRVFKQLLVLTAISLLPMAQARFKGTYTGAMLDSSNNMVTATAVTVSGTSYLRVSWHNSSNSSKWVKDVPAPTGGWSYTGNQCVAEDSSGNVYALSAITSSSGQEFEIVKVDSTGTTYTLANPPLNPAYPSYSGVVVPIGLFVGYNNNIYMVGSTNNTFLSSPATYIAQYNSSLTYVTFNNVGSGEIGDDAVMDSSNNIYVSGVTYSSGNHYLNIDKFATNISGSAGLSNSWTQSSQISSSYTASGINNGGCLTLDGSGNLTYVISANDAFSNVYCIGFQCTTSNSFNWNVGTYQLGSGFTTISSTVVDSSGNLYLVMSGSGSSYQLSEISTSGSKTFLDTFTLAYTCTPTCLAMDASGDVLVAVNEPPYGHEMVQRFRANGTYFHTYDHAPASGTALSSLVFSTSTSPNFYTFGENNPSGTQYPSIYSWHGDTILWGQTMM